MGDDLAGRGAERTPSTRCFATRPTRTGRMRLVEWAEMVQAHPDWLAPDGLHGNETGYRERARAIAAAVRDCAPVRTAEAS